MHSLIPNLILLQVLPKPINVLWAIKLALLRWYSYGHDIYFSGPGRKFACFRRICRILVSQAQGRCRNRVDCRFTNHPLNRNPPWIPIRNVKDVGSRLVAILTTHF